LGSGYLQWGSDESAKAKEEKDAARLYEQVSPKDGYNLSVSYGDLGPQLIKSGVIDYQAFAAIYKNAGNPLSPEQIDILQKDSKQEVVINAKNAHFLLNFFWAVGLANKNSILTEGEMVKYGDGKIENFASPGGWGLATKPVIDLYASLNLIPLTPDQQKLVENVAEQIYRPAVTITPCSQIVTMEWQCSVSWNSWLRRGRHPARCSRLPSTSMLIGSRNKL
jgi:hypothetical protein